MSNNQNGHVWNLAKWDSYPAPDKQHDNAEWQISFLSKQADFDCLMLARFGMSSKTIAGYTGLTVAQVYNRLKKAGVKIRDFREGKGAYAQMVFEGVGRRAARQITQDVRLLTASLNGGKS
jgi:hypothetical protein